jgi:GH15 family glucan-1,4-alpha-glucosidase
MASSRQDGYTALGDHALLGDGHGAALASRDGRIDWLAVPKVDSPPFLAAVLDAEQGGYLDLVPTDKYSVERRYVRGTMVVETDFTTSSGTLRVTDALTEGFQGRLPWSELARSVQVVHGEVGVRWELRPGSRLATVRRKVSAERKEPKHERRGEIDD